MAANSVEPEAAPAIRDGRDEDSWDLIGLVAACWAEYPGVVLDVHGETRWLLAPATYFANLGGRIWVVEDRGRVMGSVALQPAEEPNGIELRALYVARALRRRRLGATLVGLVEECARECGAAFVDLWSDTRFLDAHRLYEQLGYSRGPTRDVPDKSNTVEYYYRKELER